MIAVAIVDEFSNAVTANTRDVVVVITDHTGEASAGTGSGCDIGDAVHVITNTVPATPTQQWRVDIGECPSYRENNSAYQSARQATIVYLTLIVIGTLVSIGGVVCLAYLHKKDVMFHVATAKHDEITRAHRWILGYGAWTRTTACTRGAGGGAPRLVLAKGGISVIFNHPVGCAGGRAEDACRWVGVQRLATSVVWCSDVLARRGGNDLSVCVCQGVLCVVCSVYACEARRVRACGRTHADKSASERVRLSECCV